MRCFFHKVRILFNWNHLSDFLNVQIIFRRGFITALAGLGLVFREHLFSLPQDFPQRLFQLMSIDRNSIRPVIFYFFFIKFHVDDVLVLVIWV